MPYPIRLYMTFIIKLDCEFLKGQNVDIFSERELYNQSFQIKMFLIRGKKNK
jgi:hypothetical protein